MTSTSHLTTIGLPNERAAIGNGVSPWSEPRPSASALTIARGLASTDVVGIEVTMTVPDAVAVISDPDRRGESSGSARDGSNARSGQGLRSMPVHLLGLTHLDRDCRFGRRARHSGDSGSLTRARSCGRWDSVRGGQTFPVSAMGRRVCPCAP